MHTFHLTIVDSLILVHAPFMHCCLVHAWRLMNELFISRDNIDQPGIVESTYKWP